MSFLVYDHHENFVAVLLCFYEIWHIHAVLKHILKYVLMKFLASSSGIKTLHTYCTVDSLNLDVSCFYVLIVSNNVWFKWFLKKWKVSCLFMSKMSQTSMTSIISAKFKSVCLFLNWAKQCMISIFQQIKHTVTKCAQI